MNRSVVSFCFLCLLTVQESAAILRFASPLQSLTIWDKSVQDVETPREKYSKRFKAGLKAEFETKKTLDEQFDEMLSKQDTESKEWPKKAAALERRRRAREERLMEESFDEATKSLDNDDGTSLACAPKDPNRYQFVGVIDKKKKKPVTWYARKKPAGAKWSMRLVHVNQDAIIKDLFNRGKVDIVATYKNTGETMEESQQRLVKSEYKAKERSWKTLWNFSPKNVFTDPSGMYWRERRLTPGVYTDGSLVYQLSYRYRDGRNGMRKVATLGKYLQDKKNKVNAETKAKLMKKMKDSNPDIVLEG